MNDLLICNECKEKYKNVSVLDTEPVIKNFRNPSADGEYLGFVKAFQCKICGEFIEIK